MLTLASTFRRVMAMSSGRTNDPQLARVKAAVKSWEKTFREEQGREPTKADIKSDLGNIGG